jgi:hypothetical protein
MICCFASADSINMGSTRCRRSGRAARPGPRARRSTEDDEGALEFHAAPGPSSASRAAMASEVETRLSGWLGRRGYLDEGPASRPDGGWWLSGASEPSGGSGGGLRRVGSGFEVNTSVWFGVLAPAARLRPKVVPVGRVAVQGRCSGARRFEPAERVPYREREAWARLLSRVYDEEGRACPRCPGRLRPLGAVLPPEADEWVRRSRFVGMESTDPPPWRAGRQVCLPFVS